MNEGWSGAGGAGFDEASRALAAADNAARGLAGAVGTSLRRAFEQAAAGGATLSDTLRGLGADLARGSLRSALAPVQNAVGQGVAGLLSRGASALVAAAGFRDGAAFSAGRVRAFARGGVVQGAHAFPLAGGVGVLGEAGPEAILPLERGADGRLGVRAGGGAAVQVTINVSTPDVAGFAQSRPQIAAAAARAIDAARRRM